MTMRYTTTAITTAIINHGRRLLHSTQHYKTPTEHVPIMGRLNKPQERHETRPIERGRESSKAKQSKRHPAAQHSTAQDSLAPRFRERVSRYAAASPWWGQTKASLRWRCCWWRYWLAPEQPLCSNAATGLLLAGKYCGYNKGEGRGQSFHVC